MEPIVSRFSGSLALCLALAACVSTPPPAPAPSPTPAPTPPPVIAAPEPQFENWIDAPQTPGDWSYVSEPQESLALFGDATPDHLFVLRCDRATRQVGIARRGTAPVQLVMRIRTETMERILTASQLPDRGMVAASLDASDPLLDAMAISRGRFAVEIQGMRTLYVPSWPEVTRVIEDCR